MRDIPEPHPAAVEPASARRTTAGRLVANILPCLRTSLVSGSIALVFLVGLPALVLLAILGILREVDPPGSTLIWGQRLTGTAIDQRWLPISQISPFLVRAVIASEDNQFCRHRGIDVTEMEAVLEQAGGPEDVTRGGSTITMQVAKNLFLWNSRSYVRKGIEIPIALAIERMWSKQRIMEVYLNIAEWGPGVFGAEAAAQYYFRKPAHRLSEREAALLAVALPNPMVRVPNRPSAHMLKVTGVVERRARLAATRMSCALRR